MIYKEIEDADKVFGRTIKVSSGSFSDGFHLDQFHVDVSEQGELDTPLSRYVVNPEADTLSVDVLETQNAAQLVDGKYVVQKSLDLGSYDGYYDSTSNNAPGTLNIQATKNYHEENWTDVTFGDYYANVYDNPITVGGVSNESAKNQMTLTYGHRHGYGSRMSGNGVKAVDVTKAIYNQYRNILLGPGDDKFTFQKSGNLSGVDKDHIYVINFSSSVMREKLDEGNLEFTLSLSQTINPKSNDVGEDLETEVMVSASLTLRDDSRFEAQILQQTGMTKVGRVFNIVKGSIADTELHDSQKYANSQNADNVGVGEGFGLVYPDLGIIILNPDALANELGGSIQDDIDALPEDKYVTNVNNVGKMLAWPGTVNPSANLNSDLANGTERNHQNFLKLFTALKEGGNFKCRSTEFIPSKHYFIRVRNTDFNYSNNPTFVYQNQEAIAKATQTNTDKNYWLGRVRHDEFVNDSKTYITTVGLYNENNELVAVAKLSVPVLKSFDTETLIKVKLDF